MVMVRVVFGLANPQKNERVSQVTHYAGYSFGWGFRVGVMFRVRDGYDYRVRYGFTPREIGATRQTQRTCGYSYYDVRHGRHIILLGSGQNDKIMRTAISSAIITALIAVSSTSKYNTIMPRACCRVVLFLAAWFRHHHQSSPNPKAELGCGQCCNRPFFWLFCYLESQTKYQVPGTK